MDLKGLLHHFIFLFFFSLLISFIILGVIIYFLNLLFQFSHKRKLCVLEPNLFWIG